MFPIHEVDQSWMDYRRAESTLSICHALWAHEKGVKWSVDQGLCFHLLICFPSRSGDQWETKAVVSLTTPSFSSPFRTFLLTRFRFVRFFQSETCRVCVVCLFFATLSGGERSNTNTPFEKCSNRESEMESASRQYGGLIVSLTSNFVLNRPFLDPSLIMYP